jgi:branched-chain amino acid transport system substrate-binding protein
MDSDPKHPSRRRIMRAFGTGAATALAAPTLLTSPVRAAGGTVKVGMVSPQTGPIAAFGAVSNPSPFGAGSIASSV